MKLTIITVIISLLSMAECDPCGPSHFNTSSGCKKCFCSGVTDECHAGSFYTAAITGGLNNITAYLCQAVSSCFVKIHQNNGSEIQYRFNESDRERYFYFEFPSLYSGNFGGSYGGKLNLTLKTTLIPGTLVPIPKELRVFLLSGESLLNIDVKPVASSGNYLLYSIPLSESSWRVGSKNVLATRDDMMQTLIYLDKIQIYILGIFETEAISVKDISVDMAVGDGLPNSPRADSIEVCECPEGYSGDSCEY